MNGFFPPSSNTKRLKCLAASTASIRPTLSDPVNVISFTRGSATSCCTISGPGPETTFSTPGGSPAALKISAIFRPIIGVSSEGLRTNVFPAASAIATFFKGRNRAALKGPIPATTPSGRRTDMENWPGCSIGMVSPQTRRHSPAMARRKSDIRWTWK